MILEKLNKKVNLKKSCIFIFMYMKNLTHRYWCPKEDKMAY